ncbi:16S rRNA (cytosine(967)-C(5))-methyltransferase RsmB [Marinomonas sp. THO17]|uniref:16S rRNA (cytosine(967)-C(5))-methyltransferase RsmB n=1 Tax=Marinomonas sp. THO17 TaxID=3149048 RepID=UPI00336BB948
METNHTPRAIAVQILTQILLQQGSLSTQLNRYQDQVASEHQALLKEYCFGVCRQFPKLNSLALSLLSHPFEEKDTDLYAVLLLGLYQLIFMKTPDHAAINESVEACRALNKAWATKLVNAILRRYQREGNQLLDNLTSMPSVEFNHPKWLVKRYKKHWPDQFQQIVAANNQHPPMCLRVNLNRVSRETYLSELGKLGIKAVIGIHSRSALYLESAVSVNQLPGFDDGLCSIQDESAQLAAEILNPNVTENLLDACAAPGGKTGHLLETLAQSSAKNSKDESIAEGKLTAIELERWRLDKIESNLARLGYSAELICADASDINTWWNGEYFNKVLLDAPCSATGVIRRNPDIKINRKPADLEALVGIQQTILHKVWQTLKPGGYLLYATCSLMPEENEQQIAAFLASQSDALEVDLATLNPHLLKLFSDDQVDPLGKKVSHGYQIFPRTEYQDGFYYCLLMKDA